MRKSSWLKVIGLAGVAGVAAGGAVVARDQRRRKAYTPDEVRERLQKRLAETTRAETTPAETTPAETTPAETTRAETTPAETAK
jgi:hypothetical protein